MQNMIFQSKKIPINYKTFGKGPTIVLLHGFLESTTMWKPFLPQLAKDHFVVAIDLPGHGKSGVVAEIHTMELMAEVVDGILHTLQIPEATFIGHSMGGYIALAYAEMFPHKVEKLVLLNSTPAADSEERKKNRDRALKVIDQNPRAYISMAIGNLFAENSLKNFQKEIENIKKEAFTFPVEGIKAAIKGMRDRKDRTDVLKNFTKSKYVLLSQADPILPVSETKSLAERAKACVTIIGGGHMSTIENKAAISEYLHFIE